MGDISTKAKRKEKKIYHCKVLTLYTKSYGITGRYTGIS